MPNLHCPQCTYSLQGNTTGACPECGAAVYRDVLNHELDERDRDIDRSVAQWIKLAIGGGVCCLLLSAVLPENWAVVLAILPPLIVALLCLAACEVAARNVRWLSYRQRVLQGRTPSRFEDVAVFLSTLIILMLGSCLAVAPGLILCVVRFL